VMILIDDLIVTRWWGCDDVLTVYVRLEYTGDLEDIYIIWLEDQSRSRR